MNCFKGFFLLFQCVRHQIHALSCLSPHPLVSAHSAHSSPSDHPSPSPPCRPLVPTRPLCPAQPLSPVRPPVRPLSTLATLSTAGPSPPCPRHLPRPHLLHLAIGRVGTMPCVTSLHRSTDTCTRELQTNYQHRTNHRPSFTYHAVTTRRYITQVIDSLERFGGSDLISRSINARSAECSSTANRDIQTHTSF